MKVNIVGNRQSALPKPPFTVLLNSPEDWYSLFAAHPELHNTHQWAGGKKQTLELNPHGRYRYFHADGRIQWSSDLDYDYKHYTVVRWPA